MANNNAPCVTYKNNKLPCLAAASLLNPFQHRWGFVINDNHLNLQSGDPIEFSGMSLTITHTVLRPSRSINSIQCNTPGKEIYFEAWNIK